MGSGFGDITPQDKMHLILNMLMIICGVLFFGCVYGAAHKNQIKLRLYQKLEYIFFIDMFMLVYQVIKQAFIVHCRHIKKC